MESNSELHVVFRFILAALATWRLAFLIAREKGPWEVFSRLRSRFTNAFYIDLFSCVKCVGVWIAVPFAIFVDGSWLDIFVIWLALAGVTALIDEWIRPPFEWQDMKENGMLWRETGGSDD